MNGGKTKVVIVHYGELKSSKIENVPGTLKVPGT